MNEARQEKGVDYHETFSPVVKSTSIRLVLNIAITHGWILSQIDIGNAFLNGILQEHIVMKQPIGFVDEAHPDQVYLFKKAVQWFNQLRDLLFSLGFIGSSADPSLFILHSY